MTDVRSIFPVYPGTALRRGSSGGNVRYIQLALGAIREGRYPQLSAIAADGIFGAATERAVKQYQTIKAITADGVVGRTTWDRMTTDLVSFWTGSPAYPGRVLRQGNTGRETLIMQLMLGNIASRYTSILSLRDDGVFGADTAHAVQQFQRQFGLSADGEIGRQTWERIVALSDAVTKDRTVDVTTPYPGYLLRRGSTGDYVRYLQSYLNSAGISASLGVDGIFGSATEAAVRAFQQAAGLKVDGIVGPATWQALVAAYNRR